MKITPVMVVEAVEPALAFWVDRIGFTIAGQVPEGDRIGFAMLTKDGTELMLQSVESVHKDIPEFTPRGKPEGTVLYIEVPDLEEVKAKLGDYPLAMLERTTFYGMREIGVHAPGGHLVMFAAKAG